MSLEEELEDWSRGLEAFVNSSENTVCIFRESAAEVSIHPGTKPRSLRTSSSGRILPSNAGLALPFEEEAISRRKWR